LEIELDKFGIKNITVKDYQKVGMVDLLDEMMLGFEDSRTIEGVSKQHIQGLLDSLVTTRNFFAKRAGINEKVLKPFRRKIL
jgi:hypothetical protein